MTKLIAILIIVAAIFVGYRVFTYWENVRDEKDLAPVAGPLRPEQLPGMRYELQTSLEAATRGGAASLKNWLNAYGSMVQDPRLAWIQLDYCVMLVTSNPKEAQQLFAAVKERTPQSSPVYPRVKQLERSFE